MTTSTTHTTGSSIDAYQTSPRRKNAPQPSIRPSASRSTRMPSNFAAGLWPLVA